MSDWIVEAVLQFVNSPLWNVPVNNFIDDRCIFFDSDDSEMKLEYTPVYKEFQELIDGLLSSFVAELGVPTEEVITACRERSAAEAAKTSTKQPSGIVTVSSFLDYITYLTDFRSFKKLMERRNVELDVEASRALTRMRNEAAPVGATAPPLSTRDQRESDEERDLKLALQLSMQEAELIAKEAELQDAELQRALALSLALERERAQREAEEIERQMRIAAAHAEKARLDAEAQRRLLEIEAERQRKVAELEQQALKDRMENLVIHAERAATVTKAAEASIPAPPLEPPVAPAAAAPAQPLVEVQDVVRIVTQPDVVLPQPSDLAPLGRKGTFGAGFKPLPSIQPTFKELNSALVTQTTSPSGVQRSAPLPVAPVITATKDQPSQEELEQRARHMRQQRELLMAQRKATRATELANYTAGGAPADSSAPTAAPTDERQKQMALEIARRFREDIVGEVRRQQNSSE
jgi:hypothetical protein